MNLKKLLTLILLFASVYAHAQLDAGVVVFYLKNLPQERIGTKSDQELIKELEEKGYRVISVDCATYPRTSPQLEEALMKFHKNSPTLLAQYYNKNEIPNLDIFYVPEGYTLKKHIPIWNIKEQGADGSLERIMETYNKEIVTKYKKTPVTSPSEMVDKKGNPLDYNLYMHIIYPSGNPTKKVPLVVNFSSSSQMQKGFNPVKDKETTVYRNIFPIGFLTTGYAWANVDHPYNPLARDHVYGYFERYSLENWNGLNSASAYIRYFRSHAKELNLNGKMGAMGISKASYSTVRIANTNNATQKEHALFNNKPNTKPQPWPGVASTIDVAWAAAGMGTMRIAKYVDINTVPMATSAGLKDQYGQWKLYPPVVKHFQTHKFNHLPMWMEDMGHDYPNTGTDLATGENRYQLLKSYFDAYLKPASAKDPLNVFYIFPKEKAAEVTNKGYSRILAADNILPSDMDGVSPYAPISVRLLSAVDINMIKSKVSIVHKSTKAAVKGVWTEAVPKMVFEFVPDGELLKDNEYELTVSSGLKNFNGQTLTKDVKRNFIVHAAADNPQPAKTVETKEKAANLNAKEGNLVFFDDFERANVETGGTPTVAYTKAIEKTSGNSTPKATVSQIAKALMLSNGGQKTGSGSVFLGGELAKYNQPFKPKLKDIKADSIVWSFNFRHSATTPYFKNDDSGLGTDQNGIATVLLASNSDIKTASGYAVVAADNTYGQRYRLVRFENGLNSNSKLHNVAMSEKPMGLAGGGADYHGVKVVYIPITNTWKLYFKAKTRDNVADNTEMTLVATGIDKTLIDVPMTHFGFLNNYHTTSDTDRMVFWDNYTVKVF